MLTDLNKPVTMCYQKIDIEKLWNDRFPPLNLWNWQPQWVSEIFYNKDKDVRY